MGNEAEQQDKLVRVMGAIGALAKDKTNKHSRYDYMSEEAVKTAAQRAMVEVGVAPTEVIVTILSDVWISGKQGQQNMIKVEATIHFEDRHFSGLGAGIDYGDKALMKAQTAAIREAYKNAFCIPSGGDPEEDSPNVNEEPRRAGQGPANDTAPNPAYSARSAANELAKIQEFNHMVDWLRRCMANASKADQMALSIPYRERCKVVSLDPAAVREEATK